MDSASEYRKIYKKNENVDDKSTLGTVMDNRSNIVHKLFNREYFGSTSRNGRSRKVFDRIPPRLRFCLMDIVPMNYLREHVFMGFSQCGQFLLSFTFESNTQVYFRESSKFT